MPKHTDQELHKTTFWAKLKHVLFHDWAKWEDVGEGNITKAA